MRLLIFILATFAAALLSHGQTITIPDGDYQGHSSLANTTVTMTGRSELRLTASTTTLSGCTIHMNSTEAFIRFTDVVPSVVQSTYLSQLRVNGAQATLNSNCRIVQFGEGSVVISQPANFSPLQVFTEKYFTGSSANLNQYTAYGDSQLGIHANNIRSFRLKRGYMVTFATNSNGTGHSRNYIAQDGDLEISAITGVLDRTVSFVRVFPWRWVSKKGLAGNVGNNLNSRWWYNWNLDQNSSLDREYVAIRQNQYWPSLSQNWQSRGTNHLLGYNEPDSPDQANMTVGTSISGWPDLLATGLRVGSPSPTDGGRNWLYSFMDQANANNYRVDFLAVHYYWGFSNANDPAGAANQMYNFLKEIYDRTGKPIWVTEFNNGANWTTGVPDPTFSQQAATLQAMIDMLEGTPWIERYSIYNWVEDVRRVTWNDGWPTAAGENYRDKFSNLSYTQVIPNATVTPSAFYRFENNARDTGAYGHTAMMQGAAKCADGHSARSLSLSGSSTTRDHVLLPPRIADSNDFTFGAWVKWDGGANWQRVFDLGDSTSDYLFLSPSAGNGRLRFTIRVNDSDQSLEHSSALPVGQWTHVAVTISGNTGKLFVNGALSTTNNSMSHNPSAVGSNTNYLGRSRYSPDPYFNGMMDDVVFLSTALADAKISTLMANNPPSLTAIPPMNAIQGVPFTGSLSTYATDPDAGDTISFSKAEGPAWLSIAPNGQLTGTPSPGDSGTQLVVIIATDSHGVPSLGSFNITLPSVLGNGTWIADADGEWSDATHWQENFPANGNDNNANLSTINITANRTINLDQSRSIGSITFGDTTGTQGWTITANGIGALALSNTSGPSITVNSAFANIDIPLTSTSGLNKLGSGTLILSGNNSINGTLSIDSNSGTLAAGITRAAHPDALTGLATIAIRNNNGGSSTLEIDGSQGAITTNSAITLSARNSTLPALRNLSAANSITGQITLNVGGSNYIFQSDAGSLALGPLTSVAGSTRTLTFQGDGNFSLGNLTLGTATAFALTKNGSGTLTLANHTGLSGAIALNAGTLTTNGTGNLGSGSITTGAGTAWNNNATTTLSGSLSGPVNLITTGQLTISGNTTAHNGSFIHNTPTASTALNSASATSANATYHIASTQGSVQGIIVAGNGDYTLEMGALSGVPGSLLRGGLSATGNTTLRIGHLNTHTTFHGSINNGTNKILSLTKVGSGTLRLSGTSNYSGPTRIDGGVLSINSAHGTGTITVNSGGTLAGSGSPGGSISVQNGATLAPGDPVDPVGTMTVQQSVTLQSGSTLRLDLSPDTNSADKLIVAGNLQRGGTLLVNHLAGNFQFGQSYTLFQASSLTGSFETVTLPTLPEGMDWNTTQIHNGILSLLNHADSWRMQHFDQTFPTGDAADLADPDFDGLANLLERATLSDPNKSSPAPTDLTKSGPSIFFTYTKNPNATDLTYRVEWSDTLTGTWSALGVTQRIEGNQVTATIPAGNPSRFVRLRVTR
ncbi:MAG: glycosyl hydrolase [Akkermansiaceae bacterium]